MGSILIFPLPLPNGLAGLTCIGSKPPTVDMTILARLPRKIEFKAAGNSFFTRDNSDLGSASAILDPSRSFWLEARQAFKRRAGFAFVSVLSRSRQVFECVNQVLALVFYPCVHNGVSVAMSSPNLAF